MDESLRERGEEAIRRLDAAIARGREAKHDDIRSAVLPLVAFRDHAIDLHARGAIGRDTLDGANALLSLAYGAEFPLAGLHIDRLEQTRDGLRSLLDGKA